MNKNDSLFLLEVLIEKVTFVKTPCFSDKEFRTYVNIDCPYVQTIEIGEDDTGASGSAFVKNFNSGKSCLFSMKEADIKSAQNKFHLKVVVYKSLPCGCLPTKITLGECVIDMTKEFVQARKKYLEEPNAVSHQALKDTFRLQTGAADAGAIDMFLRVSCFGSLIVTKFQGVAGGALNLGAGGGGLQDRLCDPPKSYQTQQDPCVCGGAFGTGARAPWPAVQLDPDDPCYCSGPRNPKGEPMSCRNVDPYCLHIPKGRTKAYEEIGTNLSGNELKIKVPAHAAIIKKISQTHCSIQQPYVKGKDREGGPCEPPCGKNQISLALPAAGACGREPPLADTQFSCTTEGCIQSSKHGQQSLARGDNTKSQEPGNKDTYVLKVAKTAMHGDKKCRLELELTAPKAGDKAQPVRKENAMIQSNMDCDCFWDRSGRKRTKQRYCCPPGNKVIFQLPGDSCAMNHRQRAHFNFNSDGIGELSREEPGQLIPVTAEEYKGVVYDYPKDVIKIRIGKTVETPGHKTRLEYQFITPSFALEEKIPVTDTRPAQCVTCCPDICNH